MYLSTAEQKGQTEKWEEAKKTAEGDQMRTERQGAYSGLDSRLGHRLGAPGSEDVLVTHRGSQQACGWGHRLVGPRVEGWGRGCSPGPGRRRTRGQHAPRVSEGEGAAGRAQAPLCLQASCGEARVVRGCSTQDAQHQQVLKSFPGPQEFAFILLQLCQGQLPWLARVT